MFLIYNTPTAAEILSAATLILSYFSTTCSDFLSGGVDAEEPDYSHHYKEKSNDASTGAKVTATAAIIGTCPAPTKQVPKSEDDMPSLAQDATSTKMWKNVKEAAFASDSSSDDDEDDSSTSADGELVKAYWLLV